MLFKIPLSHKCVFLHVPPANERQTRVMWCDVRLNLTVTEETACVQRWKFERKRYLHIYILEFLMREKELGAILRFFLGTWICMEGIFQSDVVHHKLIGFAGVGRHLIAVPTCDEAVYQSLCTLVSKGRRDVSSWKWIGLRSGRPSGKSMIAVEICKWPDSSDSCCRETLGLKQCFSQHKDWNECNSGVLSSDALKC